MHYWAIAAGGALGSVLRVWLGGWIQSRFAMPFPLGLLAVNVGGCGLIGFCYIWLPTRLDSSMLSAFILAGVLGGFTTFSTFSLESVNLWTRGYGAMALLNIIISITTCVVATYIGMQIAARGLD